jgi:lysozyme
MAVRRKRKRRKKINRPLLIFLMVAVPALLITVYFFWKNKKVSNVHYPEFGIVMPGNYSIHGIDVSRYQQNIGWEAVKEMNVNDIRLGFAFIKATEGTNLTDPLFQRNWKNAKRAGIIRGAYHFFNVYADGKAQAEKFIHAVTLEKGDLPPVVDVEHLNRASLMTLKKELKVWLRLVENHFGVKPVIYTSVDFYEKILGAEFDAYPLWAAHYHQADAPRISRPWSFWQHSEEGRVNGILSRVDFNVFNGDSSDFKNLLMP